MEARTFATKRTRDHQSWRPGESRRSQRCLRGKGTTRRPKIWQTGRPGPFPVRSIGTVTSRRSLASGRWTKSTEQSEEFSCRTASGLERDNQKHTEKATNAPAPPDCLSWSCPASWSDCLPFVAAATNCGADPSELRRGVERSSLRLRSCSDSPPSPPSLVRPKNTICFC